MAGTPPLSPKAAAAAETAEAECKKCQAARDEALARAAQAEKEATDVAKEIDALAVCQGKALQHAAAARKVAAAGDDAPCRTISLMPPRMIFTTPCFIMKPPL